MNRTPRLSKSGIEYLDYMWGIWSGCQNLQRGICPVKACWAKGLTVHFPRLYPDGFNPHYYPEAIDSPKHLKKPSLIGVGWVGDVIGYGLDYKEPIFDTIRACPQHTFLFLTKNPEELPFWSPFPDNCSVGFTAATDRQLQYGLAHIADVEANIKYISFEPLLERMSFLAAEMVDWVIIGSQTRPTVMPRIEWVQEIVEAADQAEIPVFLKDNLTYILSGETWAGKWVEHENQPKGEELWWHPRQEIPANKQGRLSND